MGPGNPDYLTPKAKEIIENSDVLMGGRRHLKDTRHYGKEERSIEGDFQGVVTYIQEQAAKRKISVLVSGDPGFYSMLGYLKRHLQDIEMDVIPGISSMSYLSSRLGETWHEDAYVSLHGKEEHLQQAVKNKNKVFVLTDATHTPNELAKALKDYGFENKMMIVGENLSYEEEKITKIPLKEWRDRQWSNLNTVVIADE